MIAASFTLSMGAFQLEVEVQTRGRLLVLFGPSGAGKSLTLKAIAGLLQPTTGRISVGDEVLFDADAGIDVPAHQRRVGYVPQHNALFPFKDVLGNVTFGLARSDRRADHPRVRTLMHELGISHLSAQRPESLSGGERQRVALARALAVQPRLLLLDEPFASLDRAGRRQLGAVLRDVLDHHAIPGVLVTHDPEEAKALGDDVLLFERGRSTRLVASADLTDT